MPAGGVVARFLPSDAPLLELLGAWWWGGCRSRVTGQDVAVTPFPLLMCTSVTLATTLREVVLLKGWRSRERRGRKGWSEGEIAMLIFRFHIKNTKNEETWWITKWIIQQHKNKSKTDERKTTIVSAPITSNLHLSLCLLAGVPSLSLTKRSDRMADRPMWR